jgi:hypothetical protein
LIAALLGLFLVVPLVTLLATGSWRRTWEAIKGYSVVLALVMGIPMAIGAVMALVGLIN